MCSICASIQTPLSCSLQVLSNCPGFQCKLAYVHTYVPKGDMAYYQDTSNLFQLTLLAVLCRTNLSVANT